MSAPVISTNQSPTTGFDVSWGSTDGTSGIAGYQLQYRPQTTTAWTIYKVGGNSWYTNKKVKFIGTPGVTYDFKQIARDNAGNTSTSVIKKTVVPLNQSVFAWTGDWTNAYQALEYMGNSKYSTALNAAASYHFVNTKEIWLILTFRPSGGKADIFIGSTKIKTIDTYSPTVKYTAAVLIKTYTTAAAGTIKVVNTHIKNASSSGYRVEIDGIAIKK